MNKSNQTRSQFLSKKGRQGLSKREQEEAWRQHRAASSGRRTAKGGKMHNDFKTKVVDDVAILSHAFPPCALHYMQALVHPFGLMTAPCIPDLHSIASKKVKVISRFNFSTGATGTGQALIAPWVNANNGSSGTISNTLYPGTTVQNYGGVGVTTFDETKLPYTVAQFQITTSNPGVQARTVGVGMRIRYIGPVLAESGQIIALRHPDNVDLAGKTFDQVKAYATAVVYPVSRKNWTYVSYRPVRPAEYHFSDSGTGTNGITTQVQSMGFLIAGTTTSAGAPGPAPFELEVVRFVEYIGSIDTITRSHTDVSAISHIRNAMSSVSSTIKPASELVKLTSDVVDEVKKYGAPAAMGAAAMYNAPKIQSLLSSSATTAEGSSGFFSSILEGIESIGSSATGFITDLLPESVMSVAEMAPLMLAL